MWTYTNNISLKTHNIHIQQKCQNMKKEIFFLLFISPSTMHNLHPREGKHWGKHISVTAMPAQLMMLAIFSFLFPLKFKDPQKVKHTNFHHLILHLSSYTTACGPCTRMGVPMLQTWEHMPVWHGLGCPAFPPSTTTGHLPLSPGAPCPR